MRLTVTNRRQFLGGLACSVACGSVSGFASPASAVSLNDGLYASSRQRGDGKSEAVIFSPEKGDIRTVMLPGRAHDLTAHPFRNEVVAVARRPGRFLAVFSLDKALKPLWLKAGKGRHFQGHGVFSADGTLFYTAENDYDGGRGVIGVWEADGGYRQISEHSSYGIGIHEIALHPDGKTLVVANGGILTHPDSGRAKLNLATMQPSLVYLDAGTGWKEEKQVLSKGLHKLSIRHFDIAPDGTTVFGCQYQGARQDRPALVGFHKMGGKPVMVKAPKILHRQMQNYIGSVAIDSSGTIAATSAPRGNMVTFWDISSQKFLSSTPLTDGCGLAPGAGRGDFLMSNGEGRVVRHALAGEGTGGLVTAYPKSHMRWDNHMVALPDSQ